MREIICKNGSFLINETTKELPINRYKDFQKYLVQESGIGSDINGIDNHFKNLDLFLQSNKIQEALVERYNLHINFYLIFERMDIKSLAFASLVDSINGQEVTDFSERNLLKISDQLGAMKFKRGQLENILQELKKKLIANLR